MFQKLLRLLPEPIATQLAGKENITRIAANSLWLLSDKILRMLITLFVTGWLARYLSLEDFGKLNNAIAYALLFGSFATLGLDSIVIRDIVKNPAEKDRLLGTSFYLKLIAGFFTYLLSALCVLLLRPSGDEAISRYLVYIISAGIFFQSFDVIDYYFQSKIQSKYTVVAKNTAFILISGIKIAMIVMHCSLIWFGWAWLLEMMFNAVGLVWVFTNKGHTIRKWNFDAKLAVKLIKQSSAIYIAFIASFTYMKVDQIMISKMLGDTQAGLFAASAKVYDLCFFIVIVLAPSFYPSLIHIYESDRILFYKRYAQVTDIFTIMGYAVLAFVLLFGDWIIRILYGAQFDPSSLVLKIQIFGMLFMFNGGLRSSYFAIIHNLRIIMITTSLSAVLNICLNYYLIKKYGITGSAFATVITHASSLFISNAFFKESRPIFKIQLESLLFIRVFRGIKSKFIS